jgi:hypothetical protein
MPMDGNFLIVANNQLKSGMGLGSPQAPAKQKNVKSAKAALSCLRCVAVDRARSRCV